MLTPGASDSFNLGAALIGSTERSEDLIVATVQPSLVGAQLDGDHLPETNGRMSVCRRCGAPTDAPGLSHAPNERQVARLIDWLMAEAGRRRAARAQELMN